MTISTDDIEKFNGPRYQALAELLSEQIRSEQLPSGRRLPPQRELAHQLSVTVGTVGRAYELLIKRGLARGEVGRGTYVLDRRKSIDIAAQRQRDAAALHNLAVNYPVQTKATRELPDLLRSMETCFDVGSYPPSAGAPYQKLSACRWLASQGVEALSDQLAFTNGAQSALSNTILGLTRSGDTILTEPLCYPGIKNMCRTLERRLEPLIMDEFGVTPASLAAACRRHRAELLVLTPSVQNPTCRHMPEERRRDIVELARKFDLTIIEDEVYAPICTKRPATFWQLAPERSVFISSLSKFLAPSLRLGLAAAPSQKLRSILTALDHMMVAAPALSGDVFVEAEKSGLLDRAVTQQQKAVDERHTLAYSILGKPKEQGLVQSLHLWHHLRQGQNAEAMALRLANEGVRVVPSERFAVVRRDMPEAIRISLGPPPSKQSLSDALTIVSQVLSNDRFEQERII